MLKNELICPTHGPYPASLGSCPYCNVSAGRPQPPRPLDSDDMPTDLGSRGPAIGRDRPAAPAYEDDLPTDLPRAKKKGFLDLDDDEQTGLGRGARSLDETELDAASIVNGPEAILWVREGKRRGRIYKIRGDENGSMIGRKDGDIVLDDPKVSSPHAKIKCKNGTYTIWDFDSKNGTFVNGERVEAPQPLNENDLIKIGDIIFVIKLLG